MSTVLDLAIAIHATDHVSSSIDNMIAHFGLLKNATASTQAQMEKFKTMGWVGTAIAGIGAAGVAAMTHLANKAGEVQQMMIQLGGTYGLNIDDSQLKSIEQQAQTLSQQTLFSKKEVMGIGVELAHAGLTQDALKNVLPQSTMLSEVELGMGKSSSAERTAYNFARMVDDMGIAGNMKAMSEFADQLSRVVSITHASSESIGESMKYAALRARESGLDANDLVLAFGQSARSGMEGSMAGTNFTDWIERLNSEQFKIQKVGGRKLEEMNQLGFIGSDNRDIFHYFDKDTNSYKLKHYEDLVQIMTHARENFLKNNGGDSQKFEAYMKDIFGEQGMRFALIASEGHNFDRMKGQMDQTKGLEEQIKAIRESYKGQMHVLGSNFETIGLQIGKPLLEIITPAIKIVAEQMGKLIGWFDQHPSVSKFIAEIALGGSTFMALGGTVLMIGSAFGALSLAVRTAGVGFKAISTAFSLITAVGGPVVLTIAAIAAAGYLIYRNWDKLAPYANQVWSSVKQYASVAWDWIKANIGPGAMTVWQSIQQAWGAISSWTKQVWPDLKTVISTMWMHIQNIVSFGASIIKADLTFAWSVIKTITTAVWPVIKDVISFSWDYISGMLSVGLKLLTGDWKGALDILSETGEKIWDDIKRFFVDGIDALGVTITGLATDALEWGKNIMKSFADGMEAALSYLPAPIRAAAQTVFDFLGVHSPTKEGPLRTNHLWGGNLMKSIASGMVGNLSLVEKATSRVAGAMAPSGGGLVSKSTPSGGMMVHGSLIGHLEIHQQPGEDAKTLAKQVINEIKKEFSKGALKANSTQPKFSGGWYL